MIGVVALSRRWIAPLGSRLSRVTVNLHQHSRLWDVPATPRLIPSLRKNPAAAHTHTSMFSRRPHWEETKRKWQESTGCFLIVSDCLVYFPRRCPPINPVICVGLGQSQSCVAMVRDCLHPVMLLSMWGHTHAHTHTDTHTDTHTAACPFVCAPLVSADPLLPAQPPCCFKKLASDCIIVCCLLTCTLLLPLSTLTSHFRRVSKILAKYSKCVKM